jgi:myo-inositol 2-dehydrogenase/D-chiro-inositol 1-dehydrogenase
MARLGLAGVGRIGALHAETLHLLAGVDELFIADADPVRAESVAARLGEHPLARVDELLAADLDGLVVAAPTGAHADLVLRAVEAGVSVFCEKPVAATVQETLGVLQRVEKNEGRVQVGFQRRFDPGYAAVRGAVADGTVGRVHTLRAGTADPAPPPPGYVAASGGIFKDCSVHDFDAVRWVTGREVVEVYATGSNRGEDFFAACGDVDTAAAVLRLDDDALALVSATRYNGAGYDVRFEALGTASSVAAGYDARTPLRSMEAEAGDWPPGPPPQPAYGGFLERFREAYVRELEYFVDRLLGVAGPSTSACTVQEALEAVYVAEACEQSRRERRPVRIEQVRR